jgi:hypothetical protein
MAGTGVLSESFKATDSFAVRFTPVDSDLIHTAETITCFASIRG